MLMAQLRGKLSDRCWLDSEDLLTSAVLGTLKYLPDAIARELICCAKPLVEGSNLPNLTPPLVWEFWPRWTKPSELTQVDVTTLPQPGSDVERVTADVPALDSSVGVEPDVVVSDDQNLVVIEAKLHSSFQDRQLELEWEYARAQTNKQVWVVALTGHATIPRETLLGQFPQRSPASPQVDLTRVFWLNWYQVGRFLRNPHPRLPLWAETSRWRADVLEVLSRVGVAPFDGFGRAAKCSGLVVTAQATAPSRYLLSRYSGRRLRFAEAARGFHSLGGADASCHILKRANR